MDIETLRPEPEESAKQAGLVYVSDSEPGIVRKRWGRGFTYIEPDGERIPRGAARERLEALAIPPAWSEVWICPDANGHILATGRDEQGRKQYIYHPDWRQVREETKFYRMIAFGEALPVLRRRVDADMRKRGLPREKVLAVVARLLDTTLVRVGNREYARQNDHYGLTTLRDKHATIEGSTVRFEFTGKSGQQISVEVTDRRLAQAVKACRDVPGYDLFQYIDEDGHRGRIESGDVNAYLREVTGADFTAKDFRTWGGTVLAIASLQACEPCEDEKAVARNVLAAIDSVAEQLGNTRAVCRDYYIHPKVIRCYEEGRMLEFLAEQIEEIEGLYPEECAMLALVRRLEET